MSTEIPVNVGHEDVAVSIIIRGGADKFLSRPTSRCRRTESIVSL